MSAERKESKNSLPLHGSDTESRIRSAAEQQQRNHQRLHKLNHSLKESLRQEPCCKATYLEYIEFSSANEFKRFRNISPITQDDIRSINWDDLTHDLLAS